MINRLKRLNGTVENKMAGLQLILECGDMRSGTEKGEKLLVKENLWSAISF